MSLDGLVQLNVGLAPVFSRASDIEDAEDIELASVWPLCRRVVPFTGSKSGEGGAVLLEEL